MLIFGQKNQANFVSFPWKLDNLYCHNKDEDEEDISSGRQSRIEQLAKKIMEEEAMLAQYESRQRHGSSNLEPKSVGALKRDPINLNAELDTVSERSEIDEDPTIAESIKRGKTYFKYLWIFAITISRNNFWSQDPYKLKMGDY